MIIAGMDEAGRGPAIGPLVIGLVIITDKQEKELSNFEIKDSKALTANKREELYFIIKQNSLVAQTLSVSAKDIDALRNTGKTLNQIEIDYFRQLLSNNIRDINILQLDAADVNEERFGNQFNDLTTAKIISKHKADSLYLSVSAASILAKVDRDRSVVALQEEMNEFDPELPNFGSGYPTDAKPFLEAYVKKYRKLPEIARHTWKTCSEILQSAISPKQQSLDDWL